MTDQWLRASWEQAGRPLPLTRFGALALLIRQIPGYGVSQAWFDDPTPFFQGMTARELLHAGLLEEVETALQQIASGNFS